MAVAGSLTYDTKIDKSGFENGLNSLKGSTDKAMNTIKTAVTAVATLMAALGGYAIKVGSDFEAGMSKVQAISGATKEEMAQLTEKAKEMGSKTKFSATESAEAFQYMAMAGWKTGDMLDGIEGLMNLAAASGEDLASVSDIVTDALTAFGLKAKDSAHFADVLAKASSNSNTNVGLMGATFKYVAPIAGSMGYNIEDTAVAIGLMANAGIKGEQAGTALRSMLTRLVKPPKEAATALDALNISATNSDGTMKPLSQTLKELRAKFSKLSDSQKASYASSIAGTEAISGMLAIVNASDDDFNKLTESINNADGASKEMADTMNNNLKGAVTLFKSNLESLGIEIYDQIKEPLTRIVKTATEILSKITEKLPSIINFLKQTSPLIVTITTTFMAFKAALAIQGLINGIKTAFMALNATMMANPIAVIIALIAGLVASLAILYSKSETFRNSINKAFETIKNSILKAWEKIKPALEKLGETLGKLLEKLAPVGEFLINVLGKAFELLGDVLAFIIDILAEAIVQFVEFVDSAIIFFTETIPNAIQSFIDFISQLPQKIWDFLVNGWNSIVAFFTETIPQWIQSIIDWFAQLPYMIGYHIGEILGSIIQFGMNVGNWITTELPQIIQSIIDWFAKLPDRIMEWLCKVVSNIITWGQETYNNATIWISNTINKVVEWFKSLPEKIQTWLKNAINNIIAWGQNTYHTAISWISNTINGIINWFSQLPGRVLCWLVNTINNVINWGQEMANKGKEGAENLSNNIVNTVKELPGKMLEIGKNIVTGIWNGITGMGDWFRGQVTGFFSGIVDGAKNSLGIHSPSRVFRDKVGRFIPQGIAVGIEADTDKAIKALDSMNDEIMHEMQNAVAIETGSINAKAILQSNKEQPVVIARDHTVHIDNTQNFYEKNTTPYEEQKQAKQQLRRLAYGL